MNNHLIHKLIILQLMEGPGNDGLMTELDLLLPICACLPVFLYDQSSLVPSVWLHFSFPAQKGVDLHKGGEESIAWNLKAALSQYLNLFCHLATPTTPHISSTPSAIHVWLLSNKWLLSNVTDIKWLLSNRRLMWRCCPDLLQQGSHSFFLQLHHVGLVGQLLPTPVHKQNTTVLIH